MLESIIHSWFQPNKSESQSIQHGPAKTSIFVDKVQLEECIKQVKKKIATFSTDTEYSSVSSSLCQTKNDWQKFLAFLEDYSHNFLQTAQRPPLTPYSLIHQYYIFDRTMKLWTSLSKGEALQLAPQESLESLLSITLDEKAFKLIENILQQQKKRFIAQRYSKTTTVDNNNFYYFQDISKCEEYLAFMRNYLDFIQRQSTPDASSSSLLGTYALEHFTEIYSTKKTFLPTDNAHKILFQHNLVLLLINQFEHAPKETAALVQRYEAPLLYEIPITAKVLIQQELERIRILLQNEGHILSLLTLAKAKTGELLTFAALLLYFLEKKLSLDQIINSGILQAFFLENSPNLGSEEENAIKALYNALKLFPQAKTLVARMGQTTIEIPNFPVLYTLSGEVVPANANPLPTIILSPTDSSANNYTPFSTDFQNLQNLVSLFGTTFIIQALTNFEKSGDENLKAFLINGFSNIKSDQLEQLIHLIAESFSNLLPTLAEILSEDTCFATLTDLLETHSLNLLYLAPFSPKLIETFKSKTILINYLSSIEVSPSLLPFLCALYNCYKTENSSDIDFNKRFIYIVIANNFINNLNVNNIHIEDDVVFKFLSDISCGHDYLQKIISYYVIDLNDYIQKNIAEQLTNNYRKIDFSNLFNGIEDLWFASYSKISCIKKIIKTRGLIDFPHDKYCLLILIIKKITESSVGIENFNLEFFLKAIYPVNFEEIFTKDEVSECERAVIEIFAAIDHPLINKQCIDFLEKTQRKGGQWALHQYGTETILKKIPHSKKLSAIVDVLPPNVTSLKIIINQFLPIINTLSKHDFSTFLTCIHNFINALTSNDLLGGQELLLNIWQWLVNSKISFSQIQEFTNTLLQHSSKVLRPYLEKLIFLETSPSSLYTKGQQYLKEFESAIIQGELIIAELYQSFIKHLSWYPKHIINFAQEKLHIVIQEHKNDSTKYLLKILKEASGQMIFNFSTFLITYIEALEVAAAAGNLKIFHILINKLNSDQDWVNKPEKQRNVYKKCLENSAQNGHLNIVRFLAKHCPIIYCTPALLAEEQNNRNLPYNNTIYYLNINDFISSFFLAIKNEKLEVLKFIHSYLLSFNYDIIKNNAHEIFNYFFNIKEKQINIWLISEIFPIKHEILDETKIITILNFSFENNIVELVEYILKLPNINKILSDYHFSDEELKSKKEFEIKAIEEFTKNKINLLNNPSSIEKNEAEKISEVIISFFKSHIYYNGIHKATEEIIDNIINNYFNSIADDKKIFYLILLLILSKQDITTPEHLTTMFKESIKVKLNNIVSLCKLPLCLDNLKTLLFITSEYKVLNQEDILNILLNSIIQSAHSNRSQEFLEIIQYLYQELLQPTQKNSHQVKQLVILAIKNNATAAAQYFCNDLLDNPWNNIDDKVNSLQELGQKYDVTALVTPEIFKAAYKKQCASEWIVNRWSFMYHQAMEPNTSLSIDTIKEHAKKEDTRTATVMKTFQPPKEKVKEAKIKQTFTSFTRF